MRKRIWAGFLVVAILAGCEKPKEVVVAPPPEPTPIPTPTATPTPLPTPEPTPEPTPQARLAPEGTLYVIKAFSVTTEDGIHRFREGQEVTIVEKQGNFVTVTNGTNQAKQPISYFTNDLDALDQLLATQREQRVMRQAAFLRAQEEARIAKQEKQYELQSVVATNQTDIKTKRVAELTQTIKAAKAKAEELGQILKQNYKYKGAGKTGWASADDQVRLKQLGDLKGQIERWEKELVAIQTN